MSFSHFLSILGASLVIALGAIAVLPMTGLVRPRADVAWTASLYADKERIAAAIGGPRVLVVGGSATLFSFDSEMASRRLGRPVVNFGAHAGAGLSYILDRAGRMLRPGDAVLLTPEYELLQQGGEPNELTIQLVSFYDRGYLHQRPMTEWPHYIFGYGVLPSLAEELKLLRKGTARGRTDIVLDRLGNARGNTVALSEGAQLAGASPALPPLPVSGAANQALRKFADIAARHQVRILVIPPPLIRTKGYSDPIYRKFLSGLAANYSRLGLVMLGDPGLTFLSPEDMYDSIYHANDRGRVRYTNAILSLICPALACPK